MIIFIYTFVVIFIALLLILGVGSILIGDGEEPCEIVEGEATAAMCTTRLLDICSPEDRISVDDFVIEQDMVYTYDSFNL
ncbi:hypothetical protein D6853_02475 [Butyrivibrio sp. X503]|uniref:hypothetical protein n=1 Tax=Butyrivibrio sp. X503 TaxID=2364878 RepID=UPI000EA99700|nr:hypothetical protein [Butyrivibrio sp. X503]RKM58417.1 hypothetical protein D6853_02475 [Butyrivibrio sp. X503]